MSVVARDRGFVGIFAPTLHAFRIENYRLAVPILRATVEAHLSARTLATLENAISFWSTIPYQRARRPFEVKYITRGIKIFAFVQIPETAEKIP